MRRATRQRVVDHRRKAVLIPGGAELSIDVFGGHIPGRANEHARCGKVA